MRILTLGYLTIADASPPSLVEAAAAAGFNSVGLRVMGRKADDAGTALAGNVPAMRALKTLLASTGVNVANVAGSYLVAETEKGQLALLAETGAELGSRHIAISCYDDDKGRVIDNLQMLGDLAEPAGLKVALEFVPYSAVRTLHDAYAVVSRANRPNIGLRIDALHLIRSGGTVADLRDLPPGAVHYIQLCDGPLAAPSSRADLIEESRANRLFPGEGELPLLAFLDRFPADTEVEIEAPHAAHAALPARDRAILAMRSLRDILRRHEEQSAAAPAG